MCVCAGASKSDIQQLSCAFRTFTDMSEATGVSNGCTSCEEQAREIFDLARARRKKDNREKRGS